MLRRALRAVVLLILCSAFVPLAVVGTVLATFLFAPLPASLPVAKTVEGSQVSRVFYLDAAGNRQEIAVFREFEQNIPVQPADIPVVLKQAVISAEDKRFYEHGGVDVKGTFRAFYANFQSKGVVQGGSTITQQYVKNAYTDKQRTVTRKVREAILASQLDRQVSKEDILFKYLSTIYLGEGAYGVGAASGTYFRKSVNDLTISEAATLAGLIPSPSRYQPRGAPDVAEQRRLLVLKGMLEQRRITPEQYQAELPHRVVLAGTKGAPPGATVVYPPQQETTQFPYFVDYVRRYLIAKYGPAKLFKGGLQIQVTLDPAAQAAAEKSVADTLRGANPEIEMSLVSVEPQTGYVKALVGGRDFGANQVNLALGGCPVQPVDKVKAKVEVDATCWSGDSVEGGGTGKQSGSAFKPFTLAAAFAKGFSPNRTYRALNAYTKGSYTMKNAADGEAGGGSVTLKEATAASINTVFGQLINDVGVKETAAMAKKLGITSAWESPRTHGISYTLGVLDVSPLDMASAYGVFDNHGLRVPPTPVLKAIDAAGKVVEDNTKPAGDQVIDAVVADNMTDVLRGPIENGTASRTAPIGRPAAGKTGTTDGYGNAWFVGYTPTLSTAVQMGHIDSQTRPLERTRGVSPIYGGTLPAQTWHNFMLEALKDVPPTDFDKPAPIKPLRDALQRQARENIDPGPRSFPDDTGLGGPYIVAPDMPRAVAPVPPTTSPTTTIPRDEGGGATTTTTSTTAPPRTTTTLLPPRGQP